VRFYSHAQAERKRRFLDECLTDRYAAKLALEREGNRKYRLKVRKQWGEVKFEIQNGWRQVLNACSLLPLFDFAANSLSVLAPALWRVPLSVCPPLDCSASARQMFSYLL
jgi:hypothetical protein